MRSYILIAILTLGGTFATQSLEAQFYWLDPPAPDVTQETTIYIDVSQDPDCATLTESEGPLYVWTWEPAEPTLEDGNGTWSNSNEGLLMEQVEGTIWKITMIPTEFYGVDADEIYDTGISLLAKEKDGGSGGDCAAGGTEFKTSDIEIEVPNPFAGKRKVYSIPDLVNDSLYVAKDDVFTLYYDNTVEEKESLQNVDNMFVYARFIGDDGGQYNYTFLTQVADTPELEMSHDGNGIFSYTIIPEDFAAAILPEGVSPSTLRFQLITAPFCGFDCAVEGEFFYHFACE